MSNSPCRVGDGRRYWLTEVHIMDGWSPAAMKVVELSLSRKRTVIHR